MQLDVLAMHYLPHIPATDRDEYTLGAALWLEKRYWQQMEIAVANGIGLAFGGDNA